MLVSNEGRETVLDVWVCGDCLGPQLIALAWWLFWLASYFAPFVAVVASGRDFPTPPKIRSPILPGRK